MKTDSHIQWLRERREDIEIYYKGINITDKVGLCVCNDCIGRVKKEIDDELKMSSVWWRKFLCKFKRNTHVFRM